MSCEEELARLQEENERLRAATDVWHERLKEVRGQLLRIKRQRAKEKEN